MLFPQELLEDIIWSNTAELDSYKLERVKEEIIDQDRWNTYYRYVFKDLNTNKYYQTEYSRGSTEYQDNEGFCSLSDGMVACDEVEPVEVTVIQYRKV